MSNDPSGATHQDLSDVILALTNALADLDRMSLHRAAIAVCEAIDHVEKARIQIPDED